MTEEQMQAIEQCAAEVGRGLTIHREALIVHLCNDVPALVKEVRRLQSQLRWATSMPRPRWGRASTLGDNEVSK